MLLPSCRYLYEPLLGIVLFEMHDKQHVIHCMVSECALRSRAMIDGKDETDVDQLFGLYRSEVENIASEQYNSGSANPIVRAANLAPPPPLPS